MGVLAGEVFGVGVWTRLRWALEVDGLSGDDEDALTDGSEEVLASAPARVMGRPTLASAPVG